MVSKFLPILNQLLFVTKKLSKPLWFDLVLLITRKIYCSARGSGLWKWTTTAYCRTRTCRSSFHNEWKKKKNSIVLLKGHQKRQFFSYYQISQIKYYMHRWKIAFIKINEKMFKSAFLHCSTDRNAVNKFPSTQRPLLVGQQKTP